MEDHQSNSQSICDTTGQPADAQVNGSQYREQSVNSAENGRRVQERSAQDVSDWK